MNKNPYAYIYWGLLTFIVYSIIGLFTENEFLPNPVWLFTGIPNPGWCAKCGGDLLIIVVILILVPTVIWLHFQTRGERAIISGKHLTIIVGIIFLVSGVIGSFLLFREEREYRESQVRYQEQLQDQAIVVAALEKMNSPLAKQVINTAIEDGIADVYFLESAAPYLNTVSKQQAFLDLIKSSVLTLPNVSVIHWSVWRGSQKIITF